jgi:hypothetical protein
MSDWADDCESAFELASLAVNELQELDSKNALLWWWIKPP